MIFLELDAFIYGIFINLMNKLVDLYKVKYITKNSEEIPGFLFCNRYLNYRLKIAFFPVAILHNLSWKSFMNASRFTM